MITKIAAASVALCFVAASASAATVYNFKDAAKPENLGESAWTTFNTDLLGAGGPNLAITAADLADDDDVAYAYLDGNRAGLGVCGDLIAGATADVATGSTNNICDPGSDDGLTSIDEILTFEATEAATRIGSITVNSNHDPDDILETIWEIAGVTYDLSSGYTKLANGDVVIDLGFTLAKGDSFTVHLSKTPNSYLSSLTIQAIPVPAGGLLMLSTIGGLMALRRRRKS